MTQNILFVCSFNSGRSLLAEAIVNARADAKYRGFSAGDAPGPRVNPLTLETLIEKGVPVDGLYPKSLDVFCKPDSPKMDFVITLCDNSAGEMCPNLPGEPITGHWDIVDPSDATDPASRKVAFGRAFGQLSDNIARLFDMLEGRDQHNLAQLINMAGRSSPDQTDL
jgi:arsenate reductase (thioredoxin)